MEKKQAILIAAVCAGISMLLVSFYSTKKRQEMTSEFGEEILVVTAKKTINEYEIIRDEHLDVVSTFTKFQQPQTVKALKDDEGAKRDALNQVLGKASFVPIYPGEQITLTKLIHQDGRPVLDRQVEKKMRAITVQVSPHTGVGKLIRPGNRVDIIAIVNYNRDDQMQYEVKTVFQSVLVLATGKTIQNAVPTRFDREILTTLEGKFDQQRRKDLFTTTVDTSSTTRLDDNYQSITVQLSPEDSEKLIFLQTTIGDNRLWFTLRNNSDKEYARLDTTILDNVLGPDSIYGRSKIRTEPPPPSKPKFFDVSGSQAKPVY